MLKGAHRVVIPRMTAVCKECGCQCNSCFNNNSLDLHHEIEELRSKLKKSTSHIAQMEREFVESREYAEQEINKLQDELNKLRDRYDRLFESHKKLQRVNHNLEDKLLKVVNKFDNEKTALQKDVASITSKLVDAKVTICDLEEESERFRNDCNLAVQLLQCKPSNFVAHKLNTLPLDLQERVKSHMTREQIMALEDASNLPPPETKMIRVPMPTFPPTAMVYSVNKVPPPPPPLSPSDNKLETVPTSLIAKVLAQPDPPRKPRRVFICNKCKTDVMLHDQEVQTSISHPPIDTNGYNGGGVGGMRTHQCAIHPGVHRSRLNSTETEI